MSDGVDSTEKADEEYKKARDALRAVIVGALTASGGVAALSWTAHAHANRSSHKTAEIRWVQDRYILERETYLDSQSTTTLQLADTIKELEKFDVRRNALAAGDLTVSMTPADNIAYENLKTRRAMLESSLLYRPLTTRVVDLLGRGQQTEAISTIESSGTPDDVLQGYIFVQLDLHNASFIDGKSTPMHAGAIATVSRAAIKYADGLDSTPTNERALAALLNNYATAMAPDVGTPAPELAVEGRQAAGRALQVREKLGEPAAILRASWMVALHDYRAGDFKNAAAKFALVEKSAEKILPSEADALTRTMLDADRASAKVFGGLSNLRMKQSLKASRRAIDEGVKQLADLKLTSYESVLREEIVNVAGAPTFVK